MSVISNDVIDYIYDVHGHRITQWNRDLNPGALQRYAEAISGKGGPLHNCFGFVDGTVLPISRQNERQRIVYNGHKRVHALNSNPCPYKMDLLATYVDQLVSL